MANNFTWSVPFSFEKMPVHPGTLSSESQATTPRYATLTAPTLRGARSLSLPDTLSLENTPPEVTVVSPEENRIFPWGAQVRYEISVSDAEDGESGYGEIAPNEVLLEMEYRSVTDNHSDSLLSSSNYAEEIAGLSNIRKSACFNCHADKTTLVGPSFSQIAERYEGNQATVEQLARHISEGSIGIWGESVMPPHPQFTPEETKEMAEYILEQGSDPNRWVYLGLEGIFRIMEQPEEDEMGLYILTASYLDNGIEGSPDSALRGESSIVIRIGE